MGEVADRVVPVPLSVEIDDLAPVPVLLSGLLHGTGDVLDGKPLVERI